jgi:hypothetical protein
MKTKKMLLSAIAVVSITVCSLVYAADHIDAPAVKNQTTDITDIYVFQAQDANNMVFVANTQGLLSPGATGAAKFDPNTLIEFNIDNNGDNVEDLVIQGIYSGGKMKIYGPVKPSETGNRSRIEGAATAEVAVTPYGSAPTIATGGGLKVFAGPRDDPFFFDLAAYTKIIMGQASSFDNPGTDAFAGTNVLSLVIELPKSMLNATNNSLNVWCETKKKM